MGGELATARRRQVVPVEAVQRGAWSAADYLQGKAPTPGVVAWAAVQAAQDRYWEKLGRRPPHWLSGPCRLGRHIKDRVTVPGMPDALVDMDTAVRAITVARQIFFLAAAYRAQWTLTHDSAPMEEDVEAAAIEAMELIRTGCDGGTVVVAIRAAATCGETFVRTAYRNAMQVKSAGPSVMEWAMTMEAAASGQSAAPEDERERRKRDLDAWVRRTAEARHQRPAPRGIFD